MKKVFLLSLSLVLGLGAFAQKNIMKNDVRKAEAKATITAVGNETTTEASVYAPQASKSVVINNNRGMQDADILMTYYDLQSNQYVANRMYQLPNGNVAAVATMSHQTSNTSVNDRGTGYNFYSNGSWDAEPEARLESFQTGWPSIARYGENGEILLCHGGSHMQYFIRETAGEGEWQHVGNLPDYPAGYPYTTNYPTWPRVVTCGPNNTIVVAVAALQQSISSDETDIRTYFARTENAMDPNSWTCSYGPLESLGLGYEVGFFSADDYAMAANGNKVALLYSGCITNSTWLFQSNDCGATWTSTRVWEDPYEGADLDDPTFFYSDTLYRPMNGAVVIDNNGVTHVALNTFEMIRTEENEPGYYSYYYGRAVDGILYWNDTQVAPIQSPDGNPHHAARLWWPDPENPGYVHMDADSTRWIGFIPMYYDEGGALIPWENDYFYHAGSEYISKFYGASGHPALSCDPEGNLACAFSTPCTKRLDQESGFYFRTIIVSYRNAADGYWLQDEEDLMEDFTLEYDEATFTMAVPNTVNEKEFWFGYEKDDKIGFWWGSNASQATASENNIRIVKLFPGDDVEELEAKDVVYSIYPNPATDYIMVSSAMKANATISFINLAGQTVKSFEKDLVVGENSINIDLESGVYFCTINANGFTKAVKVVVK